MSSYQLYLNLDGIKYKVKKSAKYKINVSNVALSGTYEEEESTSYLITSDDNYFITSDGEYFIVKAV